MTSSCQWGNFFPRLANALDEKSPVHPNRSKSAPVCVVSCVAFRGGKPDSILAGPRLMAADVPLRGRCCARAGQGDGMVLPIQLNALSWSLLACARVLPYGAGRSYQRCELRALGYRN